MLTCHHSDQKTEDHGLYQTVKEVRGDGVLTYGVQERLRRNALGDSKDVATANLVTVNSVTLANGSNGGLASNYSIASGGTAAASISKAALTMTAKDDSKPASASSPYSGGNGVAYSGFVAGEGSAVLGGLLAYGGSAQGATAVGIYAITPMGLAAANYSISYRDGLLQLVAAATGTVPVASPDAALRNAIAVVQGKPVVTVACSAGVAGGAAGCTPSAKDLTATTQFVGEAE